MHQRPPSTEAITSKDHDDHDDCGVSDDDDDVNEEEFGNDDREVLCEVEPIAGVAITSMKIFMKRTSALERYKPRESACCYWTLSQILGISNVNARKACLQTELSREFGISPRRIFVPTI